MVSLCSLDWSGAHSVYQTGLKLNRDPSASASSVLELMACMGHPFFDNFSCFHINTGFMGPTEVRRGYHIPWNYE